MEKVDPDLIEKVINKVDSVLNQTINVSTRIKFPLVWARLPNGIRVQDLHEDRYNECLELIKNSYLTSEPLSTSLEILNDEESVEQFLKVILTRMKDTQSLIAVKEDENRIIGCLIERVIESILEKTMSRMMIYVGEAHCKIQRLRQHILKNVNFHKMFGTHRCNELYLWCVEEEFRGLGIGSALLKAAIRQTQLFKVSIVCGIFPSELTQTYAKEMGFQSVFEVQYAAWVEGQEVVFDNPGVSNYSACFMIMYFEPIEVLLSAEEEGEEEEEEEAAEEEDEGLSEGGTLIQSVH